MKQWAVTVATLLALLGCDATPLVPSPGELEFIGEVLVFPPTALGASTVREVTVRNTSRTRRVA